MNIQPSQWKVLITDDQEMIHVMIKHYLKDYQFQGVGLQFIDAFSGKETRTLLTKHPDIAVVVLDLMLEEPDTGFQIVKYIRETLNNNVIKIIMLTGKLDIEKAKYFFMKYDIDIYCPKHDINKIFFMITASLRAFQGDQSLYELHDQLKSKLHNQQSAKQELKALNQQLEHMVHNKDAQLQKTSHSLHEAVTYARQLTNELESSNKAKSRFLANLSHEIRTPMNGIIGMLSLALNADLNKTQHEYISLAKHAADHMLFLLTDILDFSKIEANQFSINYDSFNLKNVIESAIVPLKLPALESSLELIYEIDPAIPETLFGASDRLMQILINLIKNAIKFSEGADIQIKAKKNERPLLDVFSDSHLEIIFSVIDQGVGIAPDLQESIFEPFFQGHMALSESKGGLGLGLSICKQLVEMMGGKIWVESTPHMGSTFLFVLPFKPSQADSQEPMIVECLKETEMPCASDDKSKRPKILVADDHLLSQDIYLNALEPAGFDVTMVLNGASAVEAYENESFDAILMDIKMPEIDGLMATRLIRKKEPQGNHIPIIAVTAMVSDEDKDSCLQVGMDAFLSKPFDKDEMIQTIAKFVKIPKNEGGSPKKANTLNDLQFDINLLKSKYDNDMALVREKLNQFIQKGNGLIPKIETSLSDGNDQVTGKYIHQLMKASGEVGARKISDNAFRCKLALRKEDSEKASQMIQLIKDCFHRFVEQMHKFEQSDSVNCQKE